MFQARRAALSLILGLGCGWAVALAEPAGDPAMQAYARGIAQAKDGKFEAAITEFDQAIHLNPADAQAFDARGQAYESLHQDNRAYPDYLQAVALNPDLVAALFHRGRLRGHHGADKDAVADFDRVLKLQPDMREALMERGLAYVRLKNTARAIEDLNQAITLKPDDPQAYCDRAIAHHALDQDNLAFDDFDHALKLQPNFAPVFDIRGDMYNDLKRYERAIRDFDQAIKLKPDMAFSFLNRAVAFEKLGKHDLAIADYGEVLKLRPDFLRALDNRARIYRDLHQPGLAFADLNQAIRENPQYADALRDRGGLYKTAGRLDLAIADYSRAHDAYGEILASRPDDLEFLAARADCAYEAGRWKDAIADYSKVIAHDPKAVRAFDRRAGAYGQVHDDVAGLADTEAMLKLDPANKRGKYLHGYFERALGNYEAAIKDFGDLIGPQDDGNAVFNRGVAFFCLGRFAEAEADFRKALEAQKEVWVYNWLHVIRTKRSMPDDPGFIALPYSPLDRQASYEIANLFRGKTALEEVEVRVKASRSDRSRQGNWPCFTDFFLAEYKLEHGDISGAKAHFAEITPANCADGAAAAAVEELKRLPAN